VIGSPEVNKVLRAELSPVLRVQGFQKVEARNAWAWRDHFIWVLVVRSVGSYFSQVTGWPPMSLTVSLGVFYDFIPSEKPIKVDSHGRLLPKEYECASLFRSVLLRTIDQSERTGKLSNPAERVRKDIWWVDPNGTNVGEVVPDIASSLIVQGIPWFERLSDLKTAFNEIENDRDSYAKFRAATHFAKHLELPDKVAVYSAELAEREAELRAKGYLE
jgi:hypothetical protein